MGGGQSLGFVKKKKLLFSLEWPSEMRILYISCIHIISTNHHLYAHHVADMQCQ